MKHPENKISRNFTLSSVLVAGILIGRIGSQVLAQIKGPTDMKGVDVKELGIVSEESLKAQLGIEGFILRMRAVSVMPGGHIMEHSHENSPALVKMIRGEWLEGRPDGSETVYGVGGRDILVEDKDTVHWIYNRSKELATGVVCGIQPSTS